MRQEKVKADRVAAAKAEESATRAVSHRQDYGRKPSRRSSGEYSAIDGVRDMLTNVAASLKPTGDKWNVRRYQREDEELWASDEDETQALESRRRSERRKSHDGNSLRFPRLGHFTTPQALSDNFAMARNPPVNDLHPPIVSNPAASKVSNRWMLQPPPSPSIMNGYRPAISSRSENGSGSGSGRSSRRGVAQRWDRDTGLGRVVGQTVAMEKMKMRNSRVQDEEVAISTDAIFSEPHAREDMMYLPPQPTISKRKRRSYSNARMVLSRPIGHDIQLNSLSPPEKISPVAPGTADSGVDVSQLSRDGPVVFSESFAFTERPLARHSSMEGHAASDVENFLPAIDRTNPNAVNHSPSAELRPHLTEVDSNIQVAPPVNSFDSSLLSMPKRAHLSTGSTKYLPRQYNSVSISKDDSMEWHLDLQLERIALQLGVQKHDVAMLGLDWTGSGSVSQERRWRRSVDF